MSLVCPWLMLGDMFDPWCPTCSARVLLTTRRLLTLDPTPTGHHARLRCWCGTEVAMDIDRIGQAPVPSLTAA